MIVYPNSCNPENNKKPGIKKEEIPNPSYTNRKENRAPNLPREFCICISESVNTEIQELFFTTEKSSFKLKKNDVKEMKK